MLGIALDRADELVAPFTDWNLADLAAAEARPELAAEQPDLLLGSVDEQRVALVGGPADLAAPTKE